MSEFSIGDRVMIDSDGSYDNDGATGLVVDQDDETSRVYVGVSDVYWYFNWALRPYEAEPGCLVKLLDAKPETFYDMATDAYYTPAICLGGKIGRMVEGESGTAYDHPDRAACFREMLDTHPKVA